MIKRVVTEDAQQETKDNAAPPRGVQDLSLKAETPGSPELRDVRFSAPEGCSRDTRSKRILVQGRTRRSMLERVARGSIPGVVLVVGCQEEAQRFVADIQQERNVRLIETRFRALFDEDGIPVEPLSGRDLPVYRASQDRAYQQSIIFGHQCEKTGEQHTVYIPELVEAMRCRADRPSALCLPICDKELVPTVFEALRTYFPLIPIAAVDVADQQHDPPPPTAESQRYTEFLESYFNYESLESNGTGAATGNDHQNRLNHFDRVLAASVAQSRDLAAAILEVRPTDVTNVPKAVVEAIEYFLSATDESLARRLALTGGVGVSALLPPDLARPVSLDADFKGRVSHTRFDTLVSLLEQVGDKELKIVAHPGEGFRPNSTKICTEVNLGGETVELDMVPVRRVRHGAFVFEFKYDAVAHYLRRELELPSGNVVAVVPPEISVLEKLSAGREANVGKFDLYDAVALMSMKPLEISAIQRVIERQRYKPEIDEYPREAIGVLSTRDRLLRLGISDEELIHEFEAREADTPTGEIPLNPTLEKKLAFVDRLLRSLRRIHHVIEQEQSNNWSDKDSPFGRLMGSRLDINEAGRRVARLKNFLLQYARHHIGREDTYIRRTSKSLNRDRSPLGRMMSG